jgi:diguanylate cyclase (GGDEF)-like protein/PAS domain S-box-containing protein
MNELLQGTYNPTLVALSYCIAVIASYTALDLARSVTMSHGAARRVWLFGGAAAMGLGIWAMHFVGMLAFSLPVPVTFHIPLVALSLLAAIAASYYALLTACLRKLSFWMLAGSAILMGSGIVAMHDIGMAAMNIEGTVTYDPLLLSVSHVIAVLASLGALTLAVYCRDKTNAGGVLFRLGAGLVMGAAIAGMHYTGMAAARFYSIPGSVNGHELPMDAWYMAARIVVVTVAILGMVLFGAFMERRIAYYSKLQQESEQQHISLFRNNSEGVLTIDLTGCIVDCNPAATQITGHSAEQMCGLHLKDANSIPDKSELLANFRSALDGRREEHELLVRHAAGHMIELLVRCVPIVVKDQVAGVYAIFQDITQRKQSEAKMRYIAYYDDLTGLPNRRDFMKRLTSHVEHDVHTHGGAAIWLIDIDRFKLINDSIGTPYGDDLLRQFAQRLQGAACEGALLARVGSDEFAVLTGCGSEGEALAAAEQLVLELRQPFHVGQREIALTVSAGIAVTMGGGSDGDFEQLWQHAESALLVSKRQGIGGPQLYTKELDREAQQRLELENDLRLALEKGELLVFYQPQWDVERGALIGAEALLRWKHPVRGMVPPAEFIPIAESSGLINPIGEWVLAEACRQNKAWQDDGHAPIRIAVNLSMRQFEQPGLAEKVGRIIAAAGLDPHYVELEITESMAMDAERAIVTLSKLKQLGVHISIDDFGTGYSSLSVLKRFPIDKLKIDRSFLRDLDANRNNGLIASAIIAMAHSLNLSVIAEGVETAAQIEFLRMLACHQVQGYYYSPPLPADEFCGKWFLQRAV